MLQTHTHLPPQDAPVFAAIADPTRRGILQRLAAGEMAAGDIAEAFPISRPAVSRHLRILRQAALVREERRGRHRVYRLNAQPLREVERWLEQYRTFWEKNLASLKRHVEAHTKKEENDGSNCQNH
jgi:DNA-binding transcriptional ArsR family regulator